MSRHPVDRDWAHLFPDFRERLRASLEEAGEATGQPWILAEGLRSPERQLWLYAQGRTRPGPIVTWMRTPKWHGTGLAADCYPAAGLEAVDIRGYEAYQAACRKRGLSNPAWGRGDLGHVQLSGEEVRLQALAWVRGGFKDPAPPKQVGRVFFDSVLVPDARVFLTEGRCWVTLRPVADALGLVIASAEGGYADLAGENDLDLRVGYVLRGGRGYVRAVDLPGNASWDPKKKILRFGSGK